MEKNKKIELVFSTVYDVFRFILKTIDDHINKGDIVYAYVQHLISPFFASRADFRKIKEIAKRGHVYYVCRSDSPFDQILANFYKGFASKVKLGIDLENKVDIYIVNDLIIKIKTPSKFLKEIDDLYFDTKSILSFNMLRFFKDFADTKVHFKVSVKKDKVEAALFNSRIKKYF